MQVIDDTLTTLKTRRDEIERTVSTRLDEIDKEYRARRAKVEEDMADEITELTRLNGVIRAIEKQENRPSTSAAGGDRAPRGQNREKILAAIKQPSRPAEIMDATGIGRGSLGRSLKQLVEEGAATKRNDGSYVVATVRK